MLPLESASLVNPVGSAVSPAQRQPTDLAIVPRPRRRRRTATLRRMVRENSLHYLANQAAYEFTDRSLQRQWGIRHD